MVFLCSKFINFKYLKSNNKLCNIEILNFDYLNLPTQNKQLHAIGIQNLNIKI